MEPRFEWDPAKEEANVGKHCVTFAEAASAFGDPLALTREEPEIYGSETRYVILGESYRGRLLVVAHTERRDRIRIISARLATRGERRRYEQGE